MSAITLAELHYGVIKSAHLEKKGTPIGSLDTLIAAHALSRNLTNNLKKFVCIWSDQFHCQFSIAVHLNKLF